MTLAWEYNLVAGVHTGLHVDVFRDNGHLLSDSIVHNCQLFEADILLATVVKLLQGALYIDS